MAEYHYLLDDEMDEEIALRRTLPIPTPAPETPSQRRRRAARRIALDAACWCVIAYAIAGAAVLVLLRLAGTEAPRATLGLLGVAAAKLALLCFTRATRGAWGLPWRPDAADTRLALSARLLRLNIAQMITAAVSVGIALAALLVR